MRLGLSLYRQDAHKRLNSLTKTWRPSCLLKSRRLETKLKPYFPKDQQCIEQKMRRESRNSLLESSSAQGLSVVFWPRVVSLAPFQWCLGPEKRTATIFQIGRLHKAPTTIETFSRTFVHAWRITKSIMRGNNARPTTKLIMRCKHARPTTRLIIPGDAPITRIASHVSKNSFRSSTPSTV